MKKSLGRVVRTDSTDPDPDRLLFSAPTKERADVTPLFFPGGTSITLKQTPLLRRFLLSFPFLMFHREMHVFNFFLLMAFNRIYFHIPVIVGLAEAAGSSRSLLGYKLPRTVAELE